MGIQLTTMKVLNCSVSNGFHGKEVNQCLLLNGTKLIIKTAKTYERNIITTISKITKETESVIVETKYLFSKNHGKLNATDKNLRQSHIAGWEKFVEIIKDDSMLVI